MVRIIPTSLMDVIPTAVKEQSMRIENSSDLFLALSQIEANQALPEFLIIRNDLINLFDRMIRGLEQYALTTFQLVEDSEAPITNLDMHYELIQLKDFLDWLEEKPAVLVTEKTNKESGMEPEDGDNVEERI